MSESTQGALLAVVPAVSFPGTTESGVPWTKWLLDRVISQALAMPSVAETCVVTDKECTYLEPGDIVERLWDSLGYRKITTPEAISRDTLISELAIFYRRESERWDAYNGIVVLDPRYPLRELSHLSNGVLLYQLRQDGGHGRFPVASFSLVPNHYHPKKILVQDDAGALTYFDPAGGNIYCRQQLQGDPYYYENGAIYIAPPTLLDRASELDQLIGYVIEGPMPKVESTAELEWIVKSREELLYQ